MQDQAKKEMLILVVDDEPVMTNALGKVFSIQYNAIGVSPSLDYPPYLVGTRCHS